MKPSRVYNDLKFDRLCNTRTLINLFALNSSLSLSFSTMAERRADRKQRFIFFFRSFKSSLFQNASNATTTPPLKERQDKRRGKKLSSVCVETGLIFLDSSLWLCVARNPSSFSLWSWFSASLFFLPQKNIKTNITTKRRREKWNYVSGPLVNDSFFFLPGFVFVCQEWTIFMFREEEKNETTPVGFEFYFLLTIEM